MFLPNVYMSFFLASLLLKLCNGQGNSLKRVLTLDLGVPTIVTTTPAGAPTPTGTNLAIHEEANGDYGLYMGDALCANLESRAAACGSDDDACESSIQDGLLGAGYDLQSRQVGLLLLVGGIVLAVYAHIIIELYKDSTTVPQRVPMPALQVSSIKAATDATGVVLETAANAPGDAVPVTEVPSGPASTSAGAVTGTINPSSLTVTPVTIQTIAAGYEIDFTTDGSKELAWLQNQAKQPCSQSRKRSVGGCAVPDATAAMNALPLALLNLLTIGNVRQLPRLVAVGDLHNAIQGIFNAGRAIAALAAVSDDTLWTLAEMFLIIFDENQNHAVSIASTMTLPTSDFVQATGAVSSTESSPCQATGSDTPACPDADCSGDPIHAATCTIAGTKSGCSCAPIVTPYIYNDESPEWLDTKQQILGSIMKLGSLSMSVMASEPTCMSDGAPWFSPTAWCDCGVSAKYPTISGQSGSSVCDYSVLPTAMITPVSVSAAPTNIPGQNGLPACAMVDYPDGQGCPFANYCNCDGINVKPISTVIGGTTTSNCDISIQPTVNDCPTPTTTIAPASSAPAPSPSLVCNSGGDYVLFDRTKALNQITTLCTDYHKNKLVLSQGGIVIPPSQYDNDAQITGAAASGATLVMSPVWSLLACEDQNNPTDADFGTWTVDECVGYFMTPVDSCPNTSNPNNEEYWKIGGTDNAACVKWTVRAESTT